MKVKTLQTQSFKGLPDGIYTFQSKNRIEGKNGSGKSSLAEAILFALYGRRKTGSAEVDKLVREDQETTRAAVEFSTGTTIVREYSRFYGHKIKLDSESIEQSQLEENLPEFKTFASIFLIGFFSELDQDDQRNLILDLTPDIDIKEVFNQFTRKPDLISQYGIDLSNLDKSLKEFKAKYRDVNGAVERNKVQIDLLTQQIKTTKKPSKIIDISKLQEQLDNAKAFEFNMAEWDRWRDKVRQANESKICPTCGQPVDLKQNKMKEPEKFKGKEPTKTSMEFQEKITEAEINNQLVKNYEEEILEKQKQITDLENENMKSDERAADLKLIVDALSPKGIKATQMRQKMEYVLKPLREYIPSIDIQTLQALKTKDDYKEVFKILVNKVEYRYLSTGERKRVDIALSQVINELSGNTVDMYFLDDAELLDLEDPIEGGQTFYAFVTNGELTIKEG